MAIVKQTLAEWQAEVKERLGDPPDAAKLAFVCGRCGNVATGQDFIAIDKTPDHAAQECIGRHLNADDDPGCDWAAFGLLGPLNGRKLGRPDGDAIFVFEFAATTTKDSSGREGQLLAATARAEAEASKRPGCPCGHRNPDHEKQGPECLPANPSSTTRGEQ